MVRMADEYITEDEQRIRVNDIAQALGVEPPYVPWIPERGEVIDASHVLDRRKWRNWLDAVARAANQVGPFRPVEGEGQGTFDVSD